MALTMQSCGIRSIKHRGTDVYTLAAGGERKEARHQDLITNRIEQMNLQIQTRIMENLESKDRPYGLFPSQMYDRDLRIPFVSNGTPSAASRSSLRSHMNSDDSAAYGTFFFLELSLPHSPKKPPINRLDAMTRWHGAAGANGFLRRAAPTV